MAVDVKGGLKRMAIVAAVVWALYWLVVFGAALLRYAELRLQVMRDPGAMYAVEDGMYVEIGNMAGAIFVGAIAPAVAFFVGRYIYRGFKVGPENEG